MLYIDINMSIYARTIFLLFFNAHKLFMFVQIHDATYYTPTKKYN